MRLLIVALLLSPLSLLADMPSMKRDNFESVRIGSSVDEQCPVSKAEVDKIWDSEMLRARLAEAGNYGNEGFLWADLDCLPISGFDGKYVFAVKVEWSWCLVDLVQCPILILDSSFGLGDESFIRGAVSGHVEAAITKYLEANLR